jgi:release factor glutamine methyltransferase
VTANDDRRPAASGDPVASRAAGAKGDAAEETGAPAPLSSPAVGDLLRDGTARLAAAGSETARLDAELLLGAVLGVGRTTILAHPEARAGIEQVAAYEEALVRRASGEPVAYIRGLKEFYGLVFTVDARALIPRPETELIVELAEQHVRARLAGAPRASDAPPFLVWDVGTGSGAICVALAVSLRRRGYGGAVRFLATDRSPEALALAVENAVSHGAADLIDFGTADLLQPAAGAPEGRDAVDLVVANLPYIPSGMIDDLPVAASFEPREALDGGADGLDVVRRLLAQLPEVTASDGAALIEIGADQAAAATDAAHDALPDWSVHIHQDLTGAPRVLRVERSAQATA